MGLLAIMNPVANTPIFLGLTAGDDAATRKRVAAKATLLAFIIVALFTVSGQFIFNMFGITLPAFRITGGILVFLIGFHMLQGAPSSMQQAHGKSQAKDREAQLGVAISPLAMPILAGPGTIATAMSYSAGGGWSAVAITVGAFALLCGVTYIFFVSGQRLVQFLGDEALRVITRMMGLILAVIGTQMTIDGVRGAIAMAS